MGFHPEFECDYQTLALVPDDIFIFVTDGIYEFINDEEIIDNINTYANKLDVCAQAIANAAYNAGSDDNLSVQILKVDSLPSQNADERLQELNDLPFPPILDVRMNFDGYKILSTLHSSSRSHVYLAMDEQEEGDTFPVVLKTPSIDLKDDPAYLERFLMEEWIAKRINNIHVLKPCEQNRKREFLYTAFEYIDGQTLTQWMVDNDKPDLHTVRNIVNQIAKGATAFHRLEMVHQDLRPENIIIDKAGVVKIIDFGSTKVAGLLEMTQAIEHQNLLGTAQYSAPEYFLGELGDARADLFSIGVIAYQMLTGKLPYGTQVAKTRTRAAQHKLIYRSALHDEREIPAWVDHTLKTALQPNPNKRYQELSEFMFDLQQPSKAFLNKSKPPIMQRNPVAFWQSVCAILVIVIICILAKG
jgi:serine/threonine protein kinase